MTTKAPCPKCGAPCNRTVNMRGGEYGWSTTDEQRADYKFDRDVLLRAVADRAHSSANDGESAPDYRFLNVHINSASERYGITLSIEERKRIEKMIQKGR